MRKPNSSGVLEKTTLTLSKKIKGRAQKKLRRMTRQGKTRESLSSLTDVLYDVWEKGPDAIPQTAKLKEAV